MPNITARLSEEIVATRFEDIPAAAVAMIKRAIMDDVGIAFMAYQTVSKPLVEFAQAIGGREESTIIGEGTRVSCSLAAGINAEMSTNSGLVETGPGAHALPALAETAIAVGERVGASGKDIITAVALAYDINARFAKNLRDKRIVIHIYEPHMRRHMIVNPAICAAKVLGLSPEEVNQTIGNAWMFIPPSAEFNMRKTFWIKNFYFWFCEMGVQSALFVQNGVGGPPDILDKDGDEIYELDKLLKSPSPYYSVINELCLKPWLGSYGFMGANYLVRSITTENKLKPDDIVEIVFRGSKLYTSGPFAEREPKNHDAAANSVPWAFAMVILGYDCALDWVSPAMWKDEKALSLARKVRTEVGESPLINEVEIITRTKTYKRMIKREDFFGNPRNPMSKEFIEAKFMGLTGKLVGKGRAQEMLDIFNDLENLRDIRELTKLYKPRR